MSGNPKDQPTRKSQQGQKQKQSSQNQNQNQTSRNTGNPVSKHGESEEQGTKMPGRETRTPMANQGNPDLDQKQNKNENTGSDNRRSGKQGN